MGSLSGLKLSTRITICTVVLVAAGALVLMLVENARLRDAYLGEQRTRLEEKLHAEKLRMVHTASALRRDVLFLSNTPPVSGIMHAALNRDDGLRHGQSSRVWEERLQQVFSAFSAAHPEYYQIRYIGVADGGREIVRIDNRAGRIEATPRARLQAKGDRDYFKAALGLHAGEAYLSEVNLNHEWGGIEQPYRPTLRVIAPVFTPSGQVFGMVAINMDASHLLAPAASAIPAGVLTYITNMGGEYLLHPDAQRSFRFELGGKDNIAADFPLLKTIFGPQASGYLPLQKIVAGTDTHYLAAERIHFDSGNPARFLLLAYYLPEAVVARQIATVPVKHIIGGFIAMLLVSGIALLVLRRAFAPLEQLTAAAGKIAAGGRDAPLPQNGSGEIASLTHAFGVMLAKLSQQEQDIRWVNAWLEDRVKERTVELEHAQREAEAALRLHMAVSGTAMDGFWITDMSGNFLEVNEAYAKMSGYSIGELAGMHISQLEAKERLPEEVMAHIAKIIAQGYDRFETRHRHKDGHEVDIEISVTYMAEFQQLAVFCRDITKRKQAEEALRIAAAAFETQDAIAITDAGGNIIRVNHAFSTITGYSPEEALGKSMDVMSWEQDELDSCIGMLRQSLRDGSWAGEIFDKRKNGEIYPKWMAVTAVRNERQEITHYVTIFSDITIRKQVEEAKRRESEERFRGTLEQVAVGIAHASLEGRFQHVNEKFCTITGYGRDELLQMSFHDITFPDDLGENLHHIRRLLAGEISTFTMEKRYVRKNRRLIWVNLTVSVLRGADGESKYTIGVIEDITERKQSEALLQQFGNLLQNSFDEIYVFDANTRHFLMTSEGAEKNLGYSSDELNSLTLQDICPSFAWENFVRAAASLSCGERQLLFLETIFRRKNGTTYPVEVRMQFMESDSPMFMAIAQDVTERRRYECQLRDLSAHVQTVREEEKASIARDVHDHLGGTLTALKMDVYWLASELSANREAALLLEHIESMSQLLDNAVAVTRRIITDLRPAILDDLGLQAALEWQAEQFQKRTGIQCWVNGSCAGGCKNELDKMQTINLFRIFQESLTNVARHSGASRVEAELLCEDDEVILTISDNGCGLPEGHAIARTSYGMLGMRERVEQLGGRINFYSPPGGGLSVTVILPFTSDNQKGGNA